MAKTKRKAVSPLPEEEDIGADFMPTQPRAGESYRARIARSATLGARGEDGRNGGIWGKREVRRIKHLKRSGGQIAPLEDPEEQNAARSEQFEKYSGEDMPEEGITMTTESEIPELDSNSESRSGTVTPGNSASNRATTTSSSSTSVRGTDEASSYLSLPRELRDQTYGYILTQPSPIYIQQPFFNRAVKSIPSIQGISILCANKQINTEASKVFYSTNNFILNLNILTAYDWVSSLPSSVKGQINAITLSGATMTGYVRYDLGLYDSSRLRTTFVNKLVYDLSISSITLEVPEEPAYATRTGGAANTSLGNMQNFLAFSSSRTDFSWALCREFVEVLLSGGADSLRLLYPSHHKIQTVEAAMKLTAVGKFMYTDDEFEVDAAVKRLDMARLAGKRSEFKNKDDVESD
ncbi:hypothetical protein EJ08DRAFT_31721 [Tothia fuscella]|uniref:Uncharacterized protein n=1 Tax=Tothia fuscella TaxID=1048955 RepID=A0A9P4TT11_9PEZI|nr:hypothetical protein EJ08DRAFT_31721 [Tothia fuscella]